MNTSDITGSSVKLSWNRVTDATGYEVWRSKDRYSGYVCIYQGSATSKVSSSLSSDTRYYYKVRAYKVVDSKKVYTSYTPVISALTMPVPKIANITVLSGSSIELRWNPVNGATGYEVYRETPSGNSSFMVAGSKTSYTVDLSSFDYVANYSVRAFKEVNGETIYSEYSVAVTLMNNEIPSNVRLVNVGRNSISVQWDLSMKYMGQYTYYEVWRSKSPTSGFVCLGRYSCTSKVSTNLSPNTRYYYKVRAYSYVYDESGNIHRYYTAYSPVVSAITKK